MTVEPADDTRTRILRAALDLFAEHGYQRTSLRQIAERLRLTKAAILYHFPAKEHLLAALVEPLLSDLEALLDAADGKPWRQARWTLLEGWVDTMLAHRRPLGMLFHDIALITRGDTYHRLMHIAMRANEAIAGPDAGRRERVRAVQAVAMCSDPVVFFGDVPDEVLREDMLDGVRRLLTAPGPAAGDGRATAARRGPGRPRAMGREQVEAARRMHAAGTHSVDAIAAALGVSRATVYRHLDAASADNETV
ncbi:TetR family transcriptional regulator [Micromonospora krabiensis]|uniref:Transcriptional regulator, TetR family n=1 Tax=Micromonospora krabiensis TaxID=307121 RepID=A0A1C3MZY7_9ACTN|nr:TetR family transcriptional regulator [Micromonospora krabiensis]SBV25892.1 transcriptional regulator, TetR family [Micromonospora krabiensis]